MTNIEDTVQLDHTGRYDPAAETALSPGEIKLLRLRTNGPRGLHAVEYLARSEDNHLICITTPPKDEPRTGYLGYRCFVGYGSPLREIKIESFDRYRDGGSTWIGTPEGEFYGPRPYDNPRSATFNGKPYTLMDARGIDAVVTADGLVLR